jgi:hypothetical protein
MSAIVVVRFHKDMNALPIIIVASLFGLVSFTGHVDAGNDSQSYKTILTKDEIEPSGGFYRFIGEMAGWNIGEDGKSSPEQCRESGDVREEETEASIGEPSETLGKVAMPVVNKPEDVSEQKASAGPRPLPAKTVKAVRPAISAPYPNSYKKVDGRLVCAKKNDHPEKSKKNKKKHMDMECCLDPDEAPNPHCYYPTKKYGKYL